MKSCKIQRLEFISDKIEGGDSKREVVCIFFEKHSTNSDTHTRRSTHPYKHTHTHPTPMSTSERLSWLDLEIHEVGQQERLIIDWDVIAH
jgi:hypothetical protein